jgi:hypothetical protein
MQLKLITPNSQQFSDPVVQLIKTAHSGRLIGTDRKLFIKRAGIEVYSAVEKMAFAKDEIAIHLIAMGATEMYGANRNGDGFREQTLRDRCHTFTKYARFYRDHLNKDPSKSYGLVKAAFYNDEMKRVELICTLNATLEAARRNGGLLADVEMQKLASGLEIPVSMACSVSHDVCSYCGNKAPTRKEYCRGIDEGGMCKAGGQYRNIGRLVEVDGDAHHMHVDNPDPRFFDISNVFRPADRIAYVLGRLEKVAGHGGVICGAELAEQFGLVLPYELRIDENVPASHAKLMKIAYQLADLEANRVDNRALAFTPSVQSGVVHVPDIYRPHRIRVGEWLKASCDQRMLLAPAAYLHAICRLPVKEAEAADPLIRAQLPGIYGRLVASPNFQADLQRFACEPTSCAPVWLNEAMQKCASSFSLREPYLTHRVRLAAIRGATVTEPNMALSTKLAAADGPHAELARGYAIYKLAFLAGIPETSDDLGLTRELVSLQNLQT